MPSSSLSDDAQLANATRRAACGRARRADLHGSDVADQRRHRHRAGAGGRHDRRRIAAARGVGAARRQARRPRIGAPLRAADPRGACRAALFPARIGSGDRDKTRSTFTISRSSPPKAAAWSASKRCCAGRIRRAGAIAPSLFIPLAEESGLMIELGEIVLRRALADGARWPDLFVSVNLSPVQMRSRGLVDLVSRGARGNRHAGVARRARSHRRRSHRRSGRDPAQARSLARARRLDRARRFRHRLFELELSAKISVRPAQDRSQPLSLRSAPPAMPAPSSSRSSRSAMRSA